MTDEHTHDYNVTYVEEQRGTPRPGDGALAYYEVMKGECDCGHAWRRDTGNVSVR